MKMKPNNNKVIVLAVTLIVVLASCEMPPKKEAQLHTKHNYIVLLDLSDRLIVQDNQPQRDKQLISHIYDEFEEKVRNSL